MNDEHPPSPAPDDDNLWARRAAVHALGPTPHQKPLDLRVFHQTTWWIDISQRPHRISSEMSDLYITNVIGFLHRNRDYYYLATLRRAVVTLIGDALLGRSVGDDQFSLDTAMAELAPADWLEQTPLMQALHARLAASH
jgi:hypothetical protein